MTGLRQPACTTAENPTVYDFNEPRQVERSSTFSLEGMHNDGRETVWGDGVGRCPECVPSDLTHKTKKANYKAGIIRPPDQYVITTHLTVIDNACG